MVLQRYALALLALLATVSLLPVSARAEEGPVSESLFWFTDYAEACAAARKSERMLLIVFRDPRHAEVYDEYLKSLEANAGFLKSAANYVLCQLPTDYTVPLPGSEPGDAEKEPKRIRLLDHPAFEHLHKLPGYAIIDYGHPQSQHYGHVVNVYPFRGRFLDAGRLTVMMHLPEGSLTQRTMIFAVRTHPERPASAYGEFNPALAQESESHSRHQARIRLQGHHQWDFRFQRINARLGRGMLSQEVVAESWPGQDLVAACEECVESWRHSSGHWSAVRARQTAFAYDIKRGLNGIWYATGIFGR